MKFTLLLSEERSQVRVVNVEIEAADEMAAAEAALAAYSAGRYDTALEEAEPETTSTRSSIGRYDEEGVVYTDLLPWD
jgi:hypothetical protein